MGNKVKKTFMKKFNAHGYIDENGEQCFEWCERPVDVMIDKDVRMRREFTRSYLIEYIRKGRQRPFYYKRGNDDKRREKSR